MLIDLESTRYYRGLGDIVMWSWLAEGSKASQDPLKFHRTSHVELMSMLGLKTVAEPGGLSLDDVYEFEKRERCQRPRIDYVREFLGLQTGAVRPKLNLSDADGEWADGIVGQQHDPLVLLFPQTAWRTREWPANYWVELAWNLKRRGVRSLILLQGKDERFSNTPGFRWNTPLPRLAALMLRASLVVGNDSFPAHLAGTIGTPTLALLGPTRPTVFSHINNVECMTATGMDCTGCHFQPPFRAACDQGCMSLYRLFPESVFDRVLEKLDQPAGFVEMPSASCMLTIIDRSS